MFAPRYHPAMRHAGPVRREIGIRTVFNILGPLANPAGVRRYLLGVPSAALGETVARALVELGVERALVVHGTDGLDEISPSAETRTWEVCGIRRARRHARPRGAWADERADVPRSSVAMPATNAAAARSVLDGAVRWCADRGADECRRGVLGRGPCGQRARGSGRRIARHRQRRGPHGARSVRREEPAHRRGGDGGGMSDFLEQVIAERRADAMTSERRILEVDLARDARDNVWTRATKEGTAGQLIAASRSWPEPTFPIRYGDAFTFALQARRAEGHLAVIAEVKRVSPALGVLEANADPATLARGYAAAGATAISVLTEPRHWGGSMADLAAVREALPTMPILCKDVIVHQQQIVEARAAGADAVLLIAEALTDDELRSLDGARRAR